MLSADARLLLVLQLSPGGSSALHRVTIRTGEVTTERLDAPWTGDARSVDHPY